MKSAHSEVFSRGISVSHGAESLPHAYCTVHLAGTKAGGIDKSGEKRDHFLSPQIIGDYGCFTVEGGLVIGKKLLISSISGHMQ